MRPSSTEEVSRLLRHASAAGLRVVAQGGNTGLVGASTPDGSGEMLVLSLERLSRTVEVDPVDRTVTADGGVLLSTLDAALAEHGLLFPIDLGADPSIGGMVATNTGGTRLLRYGDVRQNLLGLEAVLADGTVLDLMRPLRKNNTGFDARQLFVGTSGVFGVVTKVVMRVVPRPVQRVTALVGALLGGRRPRPPRAPRDAARRGAHRLRGDRRRRARPRLPPPAAPARPVRRHGPRPTRSSSSSPRRSTRRASRSTTSSSRPSASSSRPRTAAR